MSSTHRPVPLTWHYCHADAELARARLKPLLARGGRRLHPSLVHPSARGKQGEAGAAAAGGQRGRRVLDELVSVVERTEEDDWLSVPRARRVPSMAQGRSMMVVGGSTDDDRQKRHLPVSLLAQPQELHQLMCSLPLSTPLCTCSGPAAELQRHAAGAVVLLLQAGVRPVRHRPPHPGHRPHHAQRWGGNGCRQVQWSAGAPCKSDIGTMPGYQKVTYC